MRYTWNIIPVKKLLFSITLILIIAASPSSESSQTSFKLQEIFTPQEIGHVRTGRILGYARIEGKGEAYVNGISVSFPRGAGSIYDNPWGYSVAAVEKAFCKGDLSEGGMIFRRLGDYPALQGMQYYSISENKPKTLILASWLSGGSSVKGSGEDLTSHSYFTIKDNRLGTIPFRGEVRSGRGTVYAASICSGSVSRYGMRIFEPGDYRAYKFFIYDKGAGGWFYCSVQLMRVRSDIMKSLDLLKPENICNRLRGETVHLLSLFGHDRSARIAAFR